MPSLGLIGQLKPTGSAQPIILHNFTHLEEQNTRHVRHFRDEEDLASWELLFLCRIVATNKNRLLLTINYRIIGFVFRFALTAAE